MPNLLQESNAVMSHYARENLGELILAALAQAGKDIDNLRPEDLAPIDEFHIRGRAATLELAEEAGLVRGARLLDVGSGIGGPSRCLARNFGCAVTGIDLSGEYCRVAAMLAKRVGLSAAVSYQQGDALALPFGDASFDVVWTQHTAMNISDKAKLYGEMGRVLKVGGTLAIYDIISGDSSPIHFPVPWASQPENSHLVSAGQLRLLLEDAGFSITSWQETTEQAKKWFCSFSRRLQENGPPPLGLQLLLGKDFPAMVQNQQRNLEEGRIATVQITASKQ